MKEKMVKEMEEKVEEKMGEKIEKETRQKIENAKETEESAICRLMDGSAG